MLSQLRGLHNDKSVLTFTFQSIDDIHDNPLLSFQISATSSGSNRRFGPKY